MAKIFLFAVLNSKGTMYELTTKGLIEIKDTKKLNSRGAICLIYEEPIGGSRIKAEYINIGIHDITLTDTEIQRENHVKFQGPSINKIFPLKTKKAVFKLSFGVKKEKLDRLFMEYEFSKIIPLSVLLWKKGRGIYGIVSEKISFFKIINKDYRECKDILEISEIIYSEEYTGTLDKDNLTVLNNIYQANNEFENDEKTFFNYLMEDIKDEYFEDLDSIEYSQQIFRKEIENIEYFIEDNVSAFYHSKIYKPFLLLGFFILLGFSILLFTLNTKNITQNYFLEEETNTKNNLINQQTNTIKALKKENYYPYLEEYELKENILNIHSQLQKYFKFQELNELKIDIIAPGRVFSSFNVNSFNEYEKLEKFLKSKKDIKFKDFKEPQKYIFELIYNINDEAKKANVKNINNKTNTRRQRRR